MPLAFCSILAIYNPITQAKQNYSVDTEVAQLLNWAVHLSRYPLPEELPNVQFVEHDYLEMNACISKRCDVLGWYNDQNTIYIDKRIAALDSLMERSILVHEMIHYLQHQSGEYSDNCSDQVIREYEAYEIQRQYFYAYGALSPVRIHTLHCDKPALAAANNEQRH